MPASGGAAGPITSACCGLIDDQFGALLAGLEAMHEIENTHVIFISDHGDFAGKYGMLRKGDWKLVFMYRGLEELYNLAEDPFELNNRIHDPACRDARDRLRYLLLDWTARLDDTIPFDRYTKQQDTKRNYTAA